MSEITQHDVDQGVQAAREEWNRMIAESGKSQAVFIATDDRATGFLAEYESIREHVENSGLTMPHLVDGVSVKLT